MIEQPEILAGSDPSILLLCDHAANRVPGDIDLGIAPELLDRHIAWDIGAASLTRALAERLEARAILGTVSRLVIDLHRDPAHPGLVPGASDGHPIPGNVGADIPARIARFHSPYHDRIDTAVRAAPPDLIVALHSFTPALEADPTPRPWEVGLLYNCDDRAARLAIDWLRGKGHVVGDNQPYSGRLLNATQDRHAEARGIPYLTLELRNDLIGDPAGIARWAAILVPMIGAVRNRVAPKPSVAT